MSLPRRTFLRAIGAAGVAPLLGACATGLRISLADMATPQAAPGDRLDPDGVWREGVAFARWTPSAHNTQPWLVRVVSATEAELYYDPARLLRDTDPGSAFQTIGMTMFVEFLRVAVRPRGFSLDADFMARPLDASATRPVLFARLHLTRALGEATIDRQLILRRRTSRMPYDGRPIERESLSALARIAADHRHEFHALTSSASVRWALELNRATTFDDLNDQVNREELRKWIRCSDEDAATRKDGLWSDCLQLPGWLLRKFFYEHGSWGHGLRAKLCGEMLMNEMRGTRTVAWWTGPFAGPSDWIRAGQVFAQSWLELTARGIHIHPFGSVVTNAKAHERFLARTGRPAEPDKLWLLVRMGRGATPPRSYRLDEPNVFIDERHLQ